jgi:3-methyladenine DNA glycosylase AlkD
MKETLNRWESHDSFWIRRSCLIFQLRYRKETDLALLQYFISRFKPEREFFIQKAIGWSLREVSKWNPTWVAEVVQAEKLTGLAKREASKYI